MRYFNLGGKLVKKTFIIALALVLTITSFTLTGCDTTKSDRENEIKNQTYNYYEDIKQTMVDHKDASSFAKALYDFCKEEEFKVSLEKGNNLIVNQPAAEGFKDKESNLFMCEYSFDKVKESSQVMALCLSAVKNAQSNGNIRLIICPENDKNNGYTHLDEKFFKGDNVTSVVHWNKTQMFTKSSGVTEYAIERDVNYNQPLGNVAYEITIKGINEEKDRSGNRANGHKNPVTELGSILSTIRNNRINVEIASFESKGDSDIYPQGAKTVIVVDKSAQSKVEKRLESEKEKFLDDVLEKDVNASFEYKIVDTPNKVLSYDDSAEVMSLLYTLVDGVFATSEPDYEGDILGVSSIYNVTVGDKVEVNLISRYLNEEVRKDMDMTYNVTAQLSDFKLHKNEKDAIWDGNEESPFFEKNRLKKALEGNGIDRKYKSMLEYNLLAYVNKHNEKANKMILGVNIDEAMQDVMALIEYLDQSDVD